MKALSILAILDAAVRVLERQEVVRQGLSAVKDEVAKMVAAGREPSAAEWDALEKRLSKATDTLNKRADEAKKLPKR